MSTPISLSSLAAATITYNGVQFGGEEATFVSTPPEYQFRGQFVYDQSGRAVKGTKYTLTVSSIFTELTETRDAVSGDVFNPNNAQTLRDKLSTPRKELKIVGLGTAFAYISLDHDWGPKPIGYDWKPLGPESWHLTWVVEFFVKDCSEARQSNAWNKLLAFNFSTAWNNNYEGLSTRTISGYAEIALNVPAAGAEEIRKIPETTADKMRSTLNVIVPNGYRRVQNSWQENEAKNRVDFSIVDQQLPGDAPPPGCISCHGEFGYSSQGYGLSKGTATLAMSVRVRPGVPAGVGGAIFYSACATKQAEMQARINPPTTIPGYIRGSVIPVALSFRNMKYDDARVTQGVMTWQIVGTMKQVLESIGIWKPLTPNNYTSWRADIQAVCWRNRGLAVNGSTARSNPTEGVVIDLCDQQDSLSIGSLSAGVSVSGATRSGTLADPVILPGSGVIFYKSKLVPQVKQDSIGHKKAVEVDPKAADTKKPDVKRGGKSPLKAPPAGKKIPYDAETAVSSHTEFLGRPVTYLAFHQSCARAQYYPELPVLKSIDGQPVEHLRTEGGVPTAMYDSIVPIWYTERVDYYRVVGYINNVEGLENPTVSNAENYYKDTV